MPGAVRNSRASSFGRLGFDPFRIRSYISSVIPGIAPGLRTCFGMRRAYSPACCSDALRKVTVCL
jgi:hypothetical protein